ncbi:nitroreductase family protein [Actinophytocola gossypii]|uniref:Nitroreductase family protein n=1 Tax=Actinophytocola gossypii TaxID=2812003 RepID=A0ABT2JA58_9PSEU|nr:nitroreductase family protein [Actinophytocola gossypii]MCT2584742.1 nitroreductase family protein [Actinophytocola gossypii]
MEFQDVVRKRRMIRRFVPDRPVPEEALERILHNATRGPSAGFSQGQAFLVLDGEDLAKFWALRPKGNDVSTAPLLIVPLSCKRVYLDRYAQPDKGWTDRDEARWPVPFWHIDTGMATLLILQTAVDLGLGALYFGIMPDDVPRFRELYGVPDDHEPIGAVAIGYPDEPRVSGSPRTRARRPLDEVVHRGAW